jgi:hypothetical protein
MGSKSPSTIGTTERWYVNAFTRGNDLPRNAQTVLACQCAMGACPGTDVLRSHGSQENTCMVAPCKADVNMLSSVHGKTYDQTYHGSDDTARQASYRDDQTTLRVSIGHCCYSSCSQDGSKAGGSPFHPTPKGTALISPRLNVGFYGPD